LCVTALKGRDGRGKSERRREEEGNERDLPPFCTFLDPPLVKAFFGWNTFHNFRGTWQIAEFQRCT